MTQRTLFPVCGYQPPEQAPSQLHSPTSVAAAEQIAPDASRLRGLIRSYLREHDGATDEEMQDGIPMAPNTERPRRRELQLSGEVVDSGDERPTKSGRMATVWRLSQRGRV